ncbi:hypothetical protein CHUAL_008354 [Chamberlinius hualienensis]
MNFLIYNKIGLNWIVKIFMLFGFRLCPKKYSLWPISLFKCLRGKQFVEWPFNLIVVGIGIYSMYLVTEDCVKNTRRTLRTRGGKFSNDHLLRVIAISCLQLSAAFHYVTICLKFTTIRALIHRLVGLIDNCISGEDHNNKVIEKQLAVFGHRLTTVLSVLLFIVAMTPCAIFMYTIESQCKKTWINWAQNVYDVKLINELYDMHKVGFVYCSWSIIVIGCCSFYSLLAIFLSFYILKFIRLYMPFEGIIDLKVHQIKHQKICQMVAIMDELFSNYLMSTLVFELLAIIIYTRGRKDMIEGSVPVLFLNCSQIFLFVLKNVACATLNHKVKTSLTVPAGFYNQKSANAVHVNYIMYVKQQMNYKPEITYGSFFPVDKNFIFTVYTK